MLTSTAFSIQHESLTLTMPYPIPYHTSCLSVVLRFRSPEALAALQEASSSVLYHRALHGKKPPKQQQPSENGVSLTQDICHGYYIINLFINGF